MLKRFLVLITLSLPLPAFCAEGLNLWIQPQVVHAGRGDSTTQVDGGASGLIYGNCGAFVFGQKFSSGYWQTYGGPMCKPLPWLEVGAGVGREDADKPNRRAAYAIASNDFGSMTAIFENGGSGAFHKVIVMKAVTDSLGIGLMDQKFLGFGPRVEYALTKNTTLSGALLHEKDSNSTNSTFAVTFSF